MHRNGSKPRIALIISFTVLLTVAVLAYYVVRSGYVFEFDIDELYHANTAYLIATGYEPFTDFFLPYSPLFHIVILPVFSLFGFTMEAIQSFRIVMIILFALRIAGVILIVRMLFGSIAAILFLPLFLLDPLTQFTSMQIRPDNYMMTVYVIALVVLTKGLLHNNKTFTFLSGILLGCAFLISIKITPSIGIIFLILLGYDMRRKFVGFSQILIGFIIPLIIFGIVYAAKGLFLPMMTNVFLDARAINEALKYPAPLGNFYLPSNASYYGTSFKPALFQYLWSLPLIAFAGVYATILDATSSFARHNNRNTVRLLLAVSLIAQWFSLFFVRSVFIQYYIPITWLFGIFAAVAIAKILQAVKHNAVLFQTTITVFGLAYAYFLIPNVQANIERTAIYGIEQKAAITDIWKYVPESSAVYPGVLFRPPAYPVTYGFTYYDLPTNIFLRYKPVHYYLEKNNVDYLNIDDKPWAQTDKQLQLYILDNYVQDMEYPLFWIRKNTLKNR